MTNAFSCLISVTFCHSSPCYQAHYASSRSSFLVFASQKYFPFFLNAFSFSSFDIALETKTCNSITFFSCSLFSCNINVTYGKRNEYVVGIVKMIKKNMMV